MCVILTLTNSFYWKLAFTTSASNCYGMALQIWFRNILFDLSRLASSVRYRAERFTGLVSALLQPAVCHIQLWLLLQKNLKDITAPYREVFTPTEKIIWMNFYTLHYRILLSIRFSYLFSVVVVTCLHVHKTAMHEFHTTQVQKIKLGKKSNITTED